MLGDMTSIHELIHERVMNDVRFIVITMNLNRSLSFHVRIN